MKAIPANIADHVGRTPMVQLTRLLPDVQVVAKLEMLNPGGAGKDRIGVAMIGAREREGLLRLYGATVQVTESSGGMNEAVAAAQALARDSDVWLPDQFSNAANPAAHYGATGPEIWE